MNKIRCPRCDSNNNVKLGKYRNNIQRFKCKECSRSFQEKYVYKFRKKKKKENKIIIGKIVSISYKIDFLFNFLFIDRISLISCRRKLLYGCRNSKCDRLVVFKGNYYCTKR